MPDTLHSLVDLLLHVDVYLSSLVSSYGFAAYVILFLIIFCETGLVVMPFLPGDSLIFAAGTLAANPNNNFSIQVLFISLLIASILGNKLNYIVGRFVGPKIFHSQQSWLLNKKHLNEAHAFYEKHGGKTIIFARFIPIIRTFVPFVAGIATMPIRSFTFYNAVSGVIWIGSLLSAGYFLGTLPWISNNFSVVLYSIIAISLLPPLLTFCYQKSKVIFAKPADNKQ
jgi:membrane-associated protein